MKLKQITSLLIISYLFIWMLIGCGNAAQQDEIVFVEPSAVQVLIAANDFEVGTPRIPLVLLDGYEAADVSEVNITLFDVSVDPPAPVWMGEATEFADYEMPYWVVRPPIDTEGLWGLLVESLLPNGTTEQYQRSIQVLADPDAPTMGERPPAVENRTSATHELSALTSGDEPDPALYQMTVADAMANDRPSVIVFATPALCETQFCAPVVDTVEAVHDQIGDTVNFIHLEIYSDFQTLKTADEVTEWNLPSEPWTFVLDTEGRVVERLAGPVSPAELIGRLNQLLPNS